MLLWFSFHLVNIVGITTMIQTGCSFLQPLYLCLLVFLNIFVDISPEAVNTSAEQDNSDHSNEDKIHDKRSAEKGINEKLSVQTKLPFKHSEQVYIVVLCAFVEKLHIKSIWTIVQNTNV